MMQCERTSDSAERYVSGAMSDAERASFEEHFFICDRCFQSVQALQDAAAVLAGSPAPARSVAPAVLAPRRSLPTAWMALAAMLIVGVVVWRLPRDGATVSPALETPPAPAATPAAPPAATPAPAPETAPAPSSPDRLSTLARVVPPPYVALTTRSEADAQAQAFESAMAQYSKGDYRAAAQRLRDLVATAPNLAHAQFFLGVSELMQRNTSRARAALERTVASGATPYAEEAHFYLGKAALQEGDVEKARRAFRQAVDVEAGPRGDAARILRELDSMRR